MSIAGLRITYPADIAAHHSAADIARALVILRKVRFVDHDMYVVILKDALTVRINTMINRRNES